MPFVYDIVSNANVLDAIEDLIGPDILMYQNGAWIKEPELGTYVSWHQDISYFGMDPPDLVTAWVALSPADMDSAVSRSFREARSSGCCRLNIPR